MVIHDLREQQSAPASGSRARFPALDALRAVGLLAVVAFHVAPTFLPGGYVGVDVFFVLSGFLITSLLLREYRSDGTIRIRRFTVRRARRLVPAAAVVVATSTTLAVLIGGDVLVGVPRQLLGIVTLSSNWQQLAAGSDYFAHSRTGLFDNFWSLAIEEQFYLVWPALLLVILRRRRRLPVRAFFVLAAVSAVAPVVVGLSGHPDAAYLATPTHAFGLVLGAALAMANDRVPAPRAGSVASRLWSGSGVLGLLALGALAVAPFAASPSHRPSTTVIGAAVGGWLVLSAVRGSATVGAQLDGSPLGWLGRRSYSTYLWHLPLIVLADAAFPQAPDAGALPGRCVAVLVAVLLSSASYHLIETKVRADGFRLLLQRPTALLLTGIVTLGLMGSTIAAVHEAPAETSTQRAIEGDGPQGSAAPRDRDVDGSSVLAIGDSVMLASKLELQQTFPGVTVDAVESRQLASAAQLVRTHLMQRPRTAIVVIGLGVNGVGGSSDLDAAIKAAGGRKVVLVDVSAPVAWESTVNTEIEQAARAHPHVAVADWRTQARAHPELIASDGIHPGGAGGKLYAGSIAAAIASLR